MSRVTVVRALTRLRLEGLVVTRHGSGTFVAATDRLVDTIAARSPRPGPHGADAVDLRWATTAGPADLIQAVQDAVRNALPAELHGDGTNGTTPQRDTRRHHHHRSKPRTLTERLAHYLTRTGLPTRPDQLTLTSGAMTGLSLVLDVAAPTRRGHGHRNPHLPRRVALCRSASGESAAGPPGPDGWDPGYLARLIRQGPPGVLYVQPDGHNPTGATMPPATRETLGRTAAAAAWLVVTDETMRPLPLAEATTTSLPAAIGHRIASSPSRR